MHVLFLALTIYLVGTTIILYLRPSIMFHPGGTWKEFSLNPGPNHTNMPFWLFSILWAFLSYLIASFIQRMMVTVPTSEIDSADFEPIDLYFHLSIQDSEKQQQNFYIFSPNVVFRRTEDCR
jgi:hypothetical protein